MKRFCICVFWEKNGIVRDYFSYYLKSLKEVSDQILVVVNGKINNDSQTLLAQMGVDILVRENNGLDFWAWKTAIERIGYDKLAEYDELLLTNCTCYGPIRPFSVMFEEMEKRDCDFWGITKHPELGEYIQSYFMVFKKNMFLANSFKKYWQQLKEITNFDEAVGFHEIQFTQHFENLGFKSDSYIDMNKYKRFIDNPMFATLELLEETNLPLIKRKALCYDFKDSISRHLGYQNNKIFDFIKNNTNYDIEMIYKDIAAVYPMSEIKSNLNLNFVLSSSCTHKNIDNRYKTALILYIYYQDLVDYCLNYAQSMPENTDIFIVSSNKNVIEYCKKQETKFPNYKFYYRIKPNRGRDVSAYLVTCSDIFKNYDLICCMHDKKTKYAYGNIAKDFSYHCFECNLKSPDYVQNIINIFDSNPSIGFLCPPSIEFSRFRTIGDELCGNVQGIKELFKTLNLNVPFDKHTPAPFGAMFWIRGKASLPLFRKNWDYTDFPDEPLPDNRTISHAIERIYPFIVQEAGYLSGWILPESYASIYINNLHHYLIEEKCKPKELSKMEQIFSITNYYKDEKKVKRLTVLGKIFELKSKE